MRRHEGRPRPRSARWAVLALILAASASSADEPKEKPKPPRAPGDSQVFEHDLAGAYFISRPLREQYDELQRRIALLKAEVRDARIDPATARAQVAAIQVELQNLLQKIQTTRVYIPAALIKTVTETSTLPIVADAMLFVEAEGIEIRGWDGPEVQCIVEKTVIGEDPTRFDADLAGITLVARQASGESMFGYYTDILKRPGGQAEWDRFPFQDYVRANFAYITIKGLAGAEGNQQISLKMLNEEGSGLHSGQWRRHARLVLRVPRCRKVAVRGALGRFRVDGLDAPLVVQGSGDRDYATTYEVTNLGGSLNAVDIPIHRLDNIRGDVAIAVTTYQENWANAHGPDGIWNRAPAPRTSTYRDIRGDLKAHFVRADLALEKIQGRVDVENEFGGTAWTIDTPLAQGRDHRLFSQSGPIDLHLDPQALGDLTLSLYTECGVLHQAEPRRGFESLSFTTNKGDEASRSWQAEVLRKDPNRRRSMEDRFARTSRPADVVRGRPRSPGVDVLSRGGTITVSPPVAPGK